MVSFFGTDDALLALLIAVRVAGALLTPIADCDEVFNYWEPVHFVLYGSGLQTWEYAPKFALRSYVYVLLHAAPAWALSAAATLAGAPAQAKLVAFYGVRTILALICAACELRFARAVRAAWGARGGRVVLALLLGSSGMYHAAPAMLPSTFVMLCTMLSAASWMRGNFAAAVASGLVGVIFGWPYVGLMFVPLFLEAVATRGVLHSIALGLPPLFVLLAIEVGVNTVAYGRPTVPTLNALAYNVFGGEERSSTLYGVESWTYYFRNALLQFNVAFALAVALPAMAVLALVLRKMQTQSQTSEVSEVGEVAYPASLARRAMLVSPFFIWIGFFTLQPHKEERFLAPAYPHLCLAAAAATLRLADFVAALLRRRSAARPLAAALVVAIAALSASRAYGVHTNYAAPMQLYRELHGALQRGHSGAVVCVGREWYRYPSKFFLPNGARLQFIDGGFTGQLPQPFLEPNGGNVPRGSEKEMNGAYFDWLTTWASTSAPREGFSDLNKGNPSRFAPLSVCDFVVEIGIEGGALGDRPDATKWTLAKSYPFLDASRSPTLARAFYVPGYSAKRNVFTQMQLFERI
jgi:alpha-1,2-mannosyltransferase